MSKRSVAVIFGGASSEYEVSLRSASFVISGVDREKYDLTMVGITKKGQWFLYTGPENAIADDNWNRPEYVTPAVLPPDPSYHGLLVFEKDSLRTIPLDVIFPVLHGKNGEDGTIQGVFQMAHPMFIKPANAGSSVGVSKAVDKTALLEGLKLAFQHDGKAIVEEFIKGREVECAVFGNHGAKASVLGEIAPKKEFYDYEAKYEDDSTDLYIPARIPAETADLVRELALAAFESLGCEGLARVDFFVQDDGIILNEVNTLPGFTGISMYPKLMMEGGMSPYDLVGGLIELAFQK